MHPHSITLDPHLTCFPGRSKPWSRRWSKPKVLTTPSCKVGQCLATLFAPLRLLEASLLHAVYPSACIYKYIYIYLKMNFPVIYAYIYICNHAIGIFQLPQRTKNHLPVHALVNIVKLDVCMQAQQCIASIRVTYTSIPACMLLYIYIYIPFNMLFLNSQYGPNTAGTPGTSRARCVKRWE